MIAKSTLPNIGMGKTIIFGAKVGNIAYGINDSHQLKWVYVQNSSDFLVSGYKAQETISKDSKAIELSRFIDLLQKANVSALELLFSPDDCIVYKDDSFDKMLSLRKGFLTKQCRWSFGASALAQIEKLNNLNINIKSNIRKVEKKTILDFCYTVLEKKPEYYYSYESNKLKDIFDDVQISQIGLSEISDIEGLYNMYWDIRYSFKGVCENDNLVISDIPKDANNIGLLYFKKKEYNDYCKEYLEYDKWLKEYNTQNYGTFVVNPENITHSIRLINTALDIADKGDLIIRRPEANFLKDILSKKQNIARLTEILSDQDMSALEFAFNKSNLPTEYTDNAYLKLANYRIRKTIEEKKQVIRY